MGGKLNVYNLGEKGVNVTKTPLHHEDGELLSAQNAEFYAESGLGGLHKRPGLQRFNTEVLAAVKGVISVPLPAPGERAVFVHLGSYNNQMKVTENGTTWANAEGFGIDVNQVGTGTMAVHPKTVQLLGQFFYVGLGEHFGVGPPFVLYGYDGEMEYELTRFDNDSTTIYLLGSHNGKLIVSEGAVTEERVWLVDPLTGEKATIGNPATIAGVGGGHVTAGCSYLGKVWIGLSGVGTTIFYAREGESTWTTDHTNGPMTSVRSMLAYQGALYVGYEAANPTSSELEKRTSAGVWSVDRTAAAVGVISNHWDQLVIHQNKLYVLFNALGTAGVDPNHAKVWENDAGSWSISKDFSGTEAGSYQVMGLLSVASTLFASIMSDGVTQAPGGVWKKVGAAAWAQSYVDAGGVIASDGGMLGVG